MKVVVYKKCCNNANVIFVICLQPKRPTLEISSFYKYNYLSKLDEKLM